MQYAENRVTRQSTKEAFRATGALPHFGHRRGDFVPFPASALATLRSMQALTSLGSSAGLPSLFIPEGRTGSPPEGRWSPLTGSCALRGYRPSMQALTGLSQPDGLTSWGISCLRTRPKGFPLVLWKPSVALLTESDRPCSHIPICHPNLRLAVLPPAAHLRHDATCHRQLAGTTRLDNDEGGEHRWPSITCRRRS